MSLDLNKRAEQLVRDWRSLTTTRQLSASSGRLAAAIAAALQAAVEEEREACAKVAEVAFPYCATDGEMQILNKCLDIARAIRHRQGAG